jgi:hypothetical protein
LFGLGEHVDIRVVKESYRRGTKRQGGPVQGT